MVNEGIGGTSADRARHSTSMSSPRSPMLVIWQVGTMQFGKAGPEASTSHVRRYHPGHPQWTYQAARRNAGRRDPDGPATPGGPDACQEDDDRDGQGNRELAADADGVNVFRRFAFMEGLHEGVSFDRMSTRGMRPDCTKATGSQIA